MAIWQILFHIIPDTSKIATPLYSKIDFDDSIFWKKLNIKKFFFRCFKNILEKNKSWSNNIDLYGNQQSNCIEVLGDDFDNVESVSFRIDFTSEYDQILDFIIQFCINNHFKILDSELNKIKLDKNEFVKHINKTKNVKKYKEFIKIQCDIK